MILLRGRVATSIILWMIVMKNHGAEDDLYNVDFSPLRELSGAMCCYVSSSTSVGTTSYHQPRREILMKHLAAFSPGSSSAWRSERGLVHWSDAGQQENIIVFIEQMLNANSC
ncbi:MAG: hypothetical protein R3D26_10625 [Cyanobacteriota/Melainabacteria group bacterium]